jgi:hypothetical protein
MTLKTPNMTDEFRQTLGSPFEEFLITCEFNQIDCTDKSNWVWFFDGYFGNCWRFNSGQFQNGTQTESVVATKGGKWNGLSLA